MRVYEPPLPLDIRDDVLSYPMIVVHPKAAEWQMERIRSAFELPEDVIVLLDPHAPPEYGYVINQPPFEITEPPW